MKILIRKGMGHTAVHQENMSVKRLPSYIQFLYRKKVQVGKDQEKAQSEKDSHCDLQGYTYFFFYFGSKIYIVGSTKILKTHSILNKLFFFFLLKKKNKNPC